MFVIYGMQCIINGTIMKQIKKLLGSNLNNFTWIKLERDSLE